MSPNPKSLSTALLVCVLAALGSARAGSASASAVDVDDEERSVIYPRVMKPLRPLGPSLDLGVWPGGVEREAGSHGSPWSRAVMDELKRSVAVDPDLPPGTALPDGPFSGWEAIAEDPLAKAPKKKQNFDGLDSDTSRAAGSRFFPPDTVVAASGSKLLQATNVAARLTNRDGSGEMIRSLYAFFNAPLDWDLFDPKAYFDPMSGRFYVIILARNSSPRRSFVYLGVSRSANPSSLASPNDFCTYRFKAKRGATWADFPGLGVNERWVAISVNNFKFGGNGGFKRSWVYTLPVDQLANNAGGCPTISSPKRFKVNRDSAGVFAFTVQPAQHYTASGLPGSPLFFVSTQFLSGTREYVLWRVEETGGGGSRMVDTVLSGSFQYTLPPEGEQKGGTGVDTGDPRVIQTAFRNGEVWAVHTTGCAIGGMPNESCIRAVRITPSAAGGALTFEETYGQQDVYFAWPGIAINGRGDVAVVFNRFSADSHIDAVFNGKKTSRSGFDSIKKLKAGNCPLDNFDPSLGLNRAGDYNGIQADPTDSRAFYASGEYAGKPGCEWRTRVGRLRY